MQDQWQIHLFGGLRAERGESVIHRFRTQKTKALLAHLAYFYRHPHPREVLMDLFWPESEPDAARHNLRMALSSLRRQLEPPGVLAGSVIKADRVSIGLNPLAISTDVAAFEATVRLAQSRSGDVEQHWMTAVELYEGRLLEGCYDDWILPEQRRLEELFFLCVHEVVVLLERKGLTQEALQYAWRGASADPLREGMQRDLMRLYSSAGQPLLALRQYQELCELLRGHLKQEPDALTKALAEQIRMEASFPHPRAPMEVQTAAAPESSRVESEGQPFAESCERADSEGGFHLPLQFTRFFGRREEMEHLQNLLCSPGVRLLTLLGMGGSGKTRLCVESINRLKERESCWPGGVWFVPLADVADANLLVGAILDALKVRSAPSTDPFEVLVELLLRHSTLLVLDSFEPIVEKGALILQRLLERVPHLRCVITSRQRLHVAGEQLFPVLPLEVPLEKMAVDELALLDSVRLFIDRAQSVQPDFALTANNAPTIGQLCARLEGSPLAIELAAARAGVFSPHRMLRLLERRFEFLVSRQRGVASRHRTLQAAIEWSYHLLELELQRFFTSLSRFRGGFTLDAAQFVSAQPNSASFLEQLRECSLVLVEESAGEMRFRLLDSIREYAGEQLEARERADLERRHAEFFVVLAESTPPEATERLDIEQDNLRAALEWSLTHSPELAIRGSKILMRFWERRGQTVEARGWLERTLERAASPAQRAHVLRDMGRIALLQGDAKCHSLLNEALRMFRELDEVPNVAITLTLLGIIALNRGQFGEADALCQESLTLWRREAPETLEGQRGFAETVSLIGTLRAAQCEFDLALPFLEEAVTSFRALKDACGLAYALDLQGQSLHRLTGNIEETRALLDESLALFRGAGERMWICRALWGRGHLARDEGNNALAYALYAESVAIALEGDNQMAMPYLLEAIGALDIEQKAPQRAARLLGAAAALRQKTGLVPVPFWMADAERALALTRTLLGEVAFEKEWATGRGLEWKEAAALALHGQ